MLLQILSWQNSDDNLVLKSVVMPSVHTHATFICLYAHFVFLARLQMQFKLIWLKLRGKRNDAVVNTLSVFIII